MTTNSRATEIERRPLSPSWLAIAILLIGGWASVATAERPPEAHAVEQGETVIDAENPVLRLEWDATWEEEDYDGPPSSTVQWNVVGPPDQPVPAIAVSVDGDAILNLAPPRNTLSVRAEAGQAELTAIDIEDLGPVTIEWRLSVSVPTAETELDLEVSATTAARPSGRARSAQWEARPDLSVYRARASAPAGASQALTVDVTSDGSARASAYLPGNRIDFNRQAVIPWPADCAAVCEHEFTVVVDGPSDVILDTGTDQGQATLTPLPVLSSTTTWTTLPPAPVLRQAAADQIHLVTVNMPAGGPLAGRAELSGHLTEPFRNRACTTSVFYRTEGGVFQPLINRHSDDRVSERAAQLRPGLQTVEIVIDPTGQVAGVPPIRDDCPLDLDTLNSVRIGVAAIGVEAPTPPEVTS